MTRLVLLFVLALSLCTAGAFAQQVPDVLHYQGNLLEDEQQVEGEVNVTARIYEEESGGQPLWEEARSNVSVSRGQLSLLLGSETAFPDGLFEGGSRYLEVAINGERLPRLRMASTAYALRAGVSSTVSDGGVDADALAPNAAVTSLNAVSGALTVEGANGATVNVDDESKTITISAPEGDGSSSGIAGLQNTDGTIQIVDPNGPTATVNLQSGSITSTYLADGSVETDDLADAAVATRKLADESVTTAKLASGATVTQLSAGTGLTADATSGAVTIDIADEGVSADQLAENAVTRRALASGVVVDGLNGLSGSVDLESSDGSIGIAPADDVIDLTLGADAAVTSLSVGGTSLTGPVALSAGSGTSLAVEGDTVAISAEGVEDAITEVSAGAGLTGGGSSGEVSLGLAEDGVTGLRIADDAIQGGTNVAVDRDDDENIVVSAPDVLTSAVESIAADGETLAGDLQFETSGSATLSVSDDNTLTFGAESGGLSSVESDGTLTGDGTSDSPLGVADGGISTSQLADNAVTGAIVEDNSLTSDDLAAGAVGAGELDTDGGPSTDQVLGYDGSGLAWTSAGSGDITSVTAEGGLSGGGDSGDVSVSIAGGGVTGPRIAGDAIQGGTNVQVGRDGSENFVVSAPDVLTSAVESIAADGETLAGDLQFETSGSATLSVSDNTLTFGAEDGGSTSVESDGTLTGDGTSDSPLGVAEEGISAEQLAENAVTEPILNSTNDPSTDQVLSYAGNDEFTWTDPSATVTTDDETLVGDGSSDDPIGIAEGGVGREQIADEAIGPDQLEAGAVTEEALASESVTRNAIVEEAVGTDQVEDESLVADDFNASNADDGYVLTYDEDEDGNLVWNDPESSLSSIRFKKDVEPIGDASSLVERLTGVRFQWKEDGREDVGLIAEEVAEVLPELVTYEDDGTTVRGLRYGPLAGVLIEAVKEQQSRLDEADETISEQEAKIEALSDRLDRLEALVESRDEEDTSDGQ